MKRLFQTLLILVTLHVLSLALPAGIALPGLPPAFADGSGSTFGDTPTNEFLQKDHNKVLVIYVQAEDEPIFEDEIADKNTRENGELRDVETWFEETSWGQCTVTFTPQRDSGGKWYVLNQGILNLAETTTILPLQSKGFGRATDVNPTPPASVEAETITDTASQLEPGNYNYAVATFKASAGDVGDQSKITKVSTMVTVAAGEAVKLTIHRAASDEASRFMVFRTGVSQPGEHPGPLYLIGYASATDDPVTFIDTGKQLSGEPDFDALSVAALKAAQADVEVDDSSYADFNGILVVLYSYWFRGMASEARSFDFKGDSNPDLTVPVSTIASAAELHTYVHEMGHWLGLPDEYSVEDETKTRELWTTMDSGEEQYMTWEKEFKLDWLEPEILKPNGDVETHGHVKIVERPAPGDKDTVDVELVPTSFAFDPQVAAGDYYTGVKVKLGEGIHYYIEGRDKSYSTFSDQDAENLVVVNRAFDQFLYTIRNLVGKPVAGELHETQTHEPEGPGGKTKVTFIDVKAGTPETYTVRLELEGEDQPNLFITDWTGESPWGTVDIWVDSPWANFGLDAEVLGVADAEKVEPKPGNGEPVAAGEPGEPREHHVYAKITNNGKLPAKNVKVNFRKAPLGMRMMGTSEAEDLKTLHDSFDLAPGESKNAWAKWDVTEEEGDAAHTCILVEIEPLADPVESNGLDNVAHENIFDFDSNSNSPWEWVEFPIEVGNPFDEPKRVDLEVAGLENGWTVELEHRWVSLEPNEFKTVNAIVKPPADEEACKAVDVEIYGLVQLDDFIQPYGGLNAIVHLANPVEFDDLRVVEPFYDPDQQVPYFRVLGTVRSQTNNEPLADREIALIITDTAGNERVSFVRTDADANFRLTLGRDISGIFTIQAYYAGDECNAPTESDILTVGDPALSPPIPFACIGEPITAQEVNTQFGYVYEPVSPFVVVPIGGPAGREINNIGYRTADDLLYGLELTLSGNQQVVVIDGFGTVFGLGRPAGLPADVRFDAGDLSPDGSTLYLGYLTELEQSLYSVDLSASPVLGAAVPIPLFGDTGTVHDLAYNRLDGKLYGGDSADGEIAVIGLGGSRTDYPVEDLPTGTAFGGAWFEGSGHLFLFENGGAIYEIDLGPLAAPAPEIVAVHTGPGAGRVDMALCHQDVLGVAKQMIAAPTGLPRPVTIDLFLENLSGGTDLSNLTAQESLSQIFGTPGVDWQLVSVTSIPLGFANPLYDGHTVTELVNQSPLQTLAAATTARVTIELDLLTHAAQRPDGYFCNQVLVFGQTAAGRWMGDLSTSGANTDPDNNGVPSEHGLSCFLGKPIFECDGEGRVTQGAGGQLDEVLVGVNTFSLSPVGGAYGHEINNIGLRRTDELLYGLELTEDGNAQVVQIDAAGTVWGLGRPAGLPADQRFDAGDVSADGETMYITRHGQPLYKLSLADVPMLPAVTSVDVFGAPGHVFDWAAHPSDGLLYGGDSSDGQMATLDPETGERIDRWVTGMPQGCPAYGAAWFNAADNLMLYCNDGRLVEIDVNLRQVVGPVKTGIGAGNNDGASCVP